ncbi:hypothetical protein AMATHDRAFT_5610 [Amanita thiersii Skay4041]|uniref:Protein artemis n=1 Tax=Amanita thiersii Skay4041 TaxID=703135 RepID=A0A2A9NLQ1_9AGAR|nr:hypothetical protein AMATHDRAFT_5610 [Amanita thiersii Skay4041]
MPPGTPFDSFVPPYRIRVDDFTQGPSKDRQAALHLLTHTHSDHINGLASKSFGYTIYCSKDAKEMLLRHEVFREREMYQMKLKAEKTRTFSHLKVDPILRHDGSVFDLCSRDLLKVLPLNTPTTIELSSNEEVTLTLIDANHCPGAVMYLIEGRKGAVLHTGDFRAEPWFLDNIARNPYLQPYIAPVKRSNKSFFNRTLEAIYLDTACAFSTLCIPSKEQATSGLIELIKLFPSDTYFFINAWTWGYEDILKVIAQTFQCQIHVDRYKCSIYERLSDPFLRMIVTTDSNSTRFHACERFDRCEQVAVNNESHLSDGYAVSRNGKHVVYVNPVTMGVESWEHYLREMRGRLQTGEVVNSLLVPLSRHSTLPELQAFVNLFEPRKVVPNTLDPRLCGLDWVAINHMFEGRLGEDNSNPAEVPVLVDKLDNITVPTDEDCDSAVKNIVGPSDMALKWADRGKLRNKLEIIAGYLDPQKKSIISAFLNVPVDPATLFVRNYFSAADEKAAITRYRCDRDSEDESDDGGREEENWRTAHLLFASPSNADAEVFNHCFTSPKSQDSQHRVKELHNPPSGQGRGDRILPVENSGDMHSVLTPDSSPLRHRPKNRVQGQDTYLGKKRSRDDGPQSRSQTKKRLTLAINRLGSPIHLRSPAMKTSRKSVSRKSRHKNVKPISSPRILKGPLEDLGQHHAVNSRNRTNDEVTKDHVTNPNGETPSAKNENVFATPHQSTTLPAVRLHHPESNNERRPRNPTAVTSLIDKPVVEPVSKVKQAKAQEDVIEIGERLDFLLKSLEVAERLALANPQRVVPTYQHDRACILNECKRLEVRLQYLKAMETFKVKNVIPDPHFDRSLSQFKPVESSQTDVNWERSRLIAESIREDLANDRWPEFPQLTCTESVRTPL